MEPTEQSTVRQKKPRRRILNPRTIVIIAVIVALASFAGYSRYQLSRLSNPTYQQSLADAKAKRIIAEVSKVMLVPSDAPQIATVSDRSKLADQAFFTDAEDGDEVLVFSTKAILYRPSQHKVINVASVTTNQPSGQAPAPPSVESGKISASSPAALRIAYYNGTEISGGAKSTEAVVKGMYPTSQTVVATDASGKGYQETLVIDLSGIHSKEAASLATLLKGVVGTLPQGEVAPHADILIILGKP